MSLVDEGLAPGFADPVSDGQSVFRSVLAGMSRPGTLQKVPVDVSLPSGIEDRAIVAICLTLADRDTPLWFDKAIASPQLESFLRFHCGAVVTTEVAQASFALVGSAADIPGLSQFNLGSDLYPDRAATVLVRVPQLGTGRGVTVTGPGVDGSIAFSVKGLRSGFWSERRSLAKLFPRGIDLVLAAGSSFVALPRTSIVTEG